MEDVLQQVRVACAAFVMPCVHHICHHSNNPRMACIVQLQLGIQHLIWTLPMGATFSQAPTKATCRMESVTMLVLPAIPLAVQRAMLHALLVQLNTQRLS